jgi:hypothetical protein
MSYTREQAEEFKEDFLDWFGRTSSLLNNGFKDFLDHKFPKPVSEDKPIDFLGLQNLAESFSETGVDRASELIITSPCYTELQRTIKKAEKISAKLEKLLSSQRS